MSHVNPFVMHRREHGQMENLLKNYMKKDGSVPFQRWFDQLDPAAATKVFKATSRMKEGNLSRVKWFAGIGEYVIDWGPGDRIYLAKDGEYLIILLGGGTKKHQQIDITRAKMLHENLSNERKLQKGEHYGTDSGLRSWNYRADSAG